MPKLTVLTVSGAILLLIGVLFVLVGTGARRESRQLEQLPILTVAGLRQSEDGRAAGIDARIAERNDLYYEGLVAYVRQEYRGETCSTLDDDCEPVWVEDERVTPPLWLDAPDGRLMVINNDYNLQNGPVIRQTGSRLIKNESKVYRGFVIGSPVFVVGQVVAGSDVPAFHADAIFGGDSASHLSGAKFAGNVFFWLGVAFSIVGFGFIMIHFARKE